MPERLVAKRSLLRVAALLPRFWSTRGCECAGYRLFPTVGQPPQSDIFEPERAVLHRVGLVS